MLVSRRNTRFSALIGPAFVGIALITGFTLISLKAVQAADRTEDIASRASRNSQQATFKVRKRGKALKGEIGLFVQPAWAKRPFRYDSKIRCR
jgi:hypothetical protein